MSCAFLMLLILSAYFKTELVQNVKDHLSFCGSLTVSPGARCFRRVVAVSWTKRHGRFRNQRLAGGVWTKQERRLEKVAPRGSFVAGVDARSNLRHRAR